MRRDWQSFLFLRKSLSLPHPSELAGLTRRGLTFVGSFDGPFGSVLGLEILVVLDRVRQTV